MARGQWLRSGQGKSPNERRLTGMQNEGEDTGSQPGGKDDENVPGKEKNKCKGPGAGMKLLGSE